MIEGSGSGSRRPNNIWNRWIRIRILNTAFLTSLSKFSHFSALYQENVFKIYSNMG